MLIIDWDKESGWQDPAITPFENLSLPPACAALHYAIECFEGMKAYKDAKGQIRLFRPDCNLERLNSSMKRLAMPSFNPEGYLECLKQLLRKDASWFPEGDGFSIYIRPTAIGNSPYLGVHASEEVKLFTILCPVGPYFKDGFKPIKLFADTHHVRSWPGGAGNAKVGGNYAPAIAPTESVFELGCSSVSEKSWRYSYH
jgi:branched-chain amino acid aminotransferase